MSLRLVVSNTVVVPVEGHIPDEQGRKSPFSFRLVCKRLAQDELKAALDADSATVPEFLADVVQGWEHVLDADGREIEFTPAGLKALLNIVGMAGVCFSAYLATCGAKGKEKN